MSSVSALDASVVRKKESGTAMLLHHFVQPAQERVRGPGRLLPGTGIYYPVLTDRSFLIAAVPGYSCRGSSHLHIDGWNSAYHVTVY